jgi:hypothetical protein
MTNGAPRGIEQCAGGGRHLDRNILTRSARGIARDLKPDAGFDPCAMDMQNGGTSEMLDHADATGKLRLPDYAFLQMLWTDTQFQLRI